MRLVPCIQKEITSTELFESVLQRCQEGLEESMRGSKLVFDSIDLLCSYKLRKIEVNHI